MATRYTVLFYPDMFLEEEGRPVRRDPVKWGLAVVSAHKISGMTCVLYIIKGKHLLFMVE